jgi:hypothetical protein
MCLSLLLLATSCEVLCLCLICPFRRRDWTNQLCNSFWALRGKCLKSWQSWPWSMVLFCCLPLSVPKCGTGALCHRVWGGKRAAQIGGRDWSYNMLQQHFWSHVTMWGLVCLNDFDVFSFVFIRIHLDSRQVQSDSPPRTSSYLLGCHRLKFSLKLSRQWHAGSNGVIFQSQQVPQWRRKGGSWPRTQAHAQSSGGEGGDRLWKDTTDTTCEAGPRGRAVQWRPFWSFSLLFNFWKPLAINDYKCL